jgi:hypothetical protein
MSLPLTRRIARTALLIAAGAAPVVGAAGSASAATTDLPATPNLAGLTALDNAQVGTTVDSAAQKVSGLAGDAGGQAVQAGGKTVKQAVPAANNAGGRLVGTAAPVAQKAAGDAAGQAGGLLGGAAKTGLPGRQLPVQGLPLGG